MPTILANHVDCRLLGHAWTYTTVDRISRFLVQGLRCVRCSTERYQKVSARTGEPIGNTYKYPEGYRVPGGLKQREKAKLRLDVFTSRLDTTTQ